MINDEKAESLTASDVPQISIGELYNERYRIQEVLGKGGMGIAYKALDTKLEKLVALKVLLPYRLLNTKGAGGRFEREAKTASRLSHPGIAKIYDFVVLNGEQPYLVMEYLEGKTLAQLIETEGQLPLEETLEIFIQICDALAYAHSNGILHRDIKPSNIMVNRNIDPSNAKLLDFGIAKPIGAKDSTYQTMTESGELVGSPLYMSPEQARNATLDERSDLYSLGSTLYEALTGGPPHVGHTSIATLLKRETDKPLAMSQASLGRNFPVSLEFLVSKLLKTNPGDRFQSASDVMKELMKIKSSDSGHFRTDAQKQTSNTKQTSIAQSPGLVWFLPYFLSFVALGALLALSLYSFIQPKALQTFPKPQADAKPASFSDEMGLSVFEKYSGAASISLGDALVGQNKISSALDAYQNAAIDLENVHRENDPKYADILTKIAYCHQALHEFDEANAYLNRGIEAIKRSEGETTSGCAFSLTFTGCKFLKLYAVDAERSFETAKPLFERSIVIQKQVDDPYSLQLADLLTMQGLACLERDLISEARGRFEPALKILHAAPTASNQAFAIATSLSSLANIYARTKQFDKIPALCSEFLSKYETFGIEDKKIYAEQLWKIADKLRMNGHSTKDPVGSYQLAERAYQTFILVFPHLTHSNTETLATVYESLGSTYFKEARHGKRDRFSMAERWFNQALKLRGEMRDPNVASMARIYLKIGNVLLSEGRLEEARSVNERGLNLYEKSKGKNSIEYAEALLYAGELDNTQSHPIKAEEKFLQALHICKVIGNTENNVAAALNADLGYNRADRGLYAGALVPLQMARGFYLSRSGPDCPNLIQLNKYLTEIYKHIQREKSGHAPALLQPHG